MFLPSQELKVWKEICVCCFFFYFFIPETSDGLRVSPRGFTSPLNPTTVVKSPHSDTHFCFNHKEGIHLKICVSETGSWVHFFFFFFMFHKTTTAKGETTHFCRVGTWQPVLTVQKNKASLVTTLDEDDGRARGDETPGGSEVAANRDLNPPPLLPLVLMCFGFGVHVVVLAVQWPPLDL